MSGAIELLGVIVEGATDRFCGRPRERNPYSPKYAPEQWAAWLAAWVEADALLDLRGRDEATRWLREAAA